MPLAAAGAVVLIGLFELGFVWSNRHRLWDANYTLLEKKRDALSAPTEADTIAVFGTSRLYHVDPKRLQAFLPPGSRVTNYSWSWCGIEAYEAMLRGLINAGRIPKILLVEAQPELFGYTYQRLSVTGPDYFAQRYAETAPFGAALRTTIGLKEWQQAWNLLTYNLSPPSLLYQDRVKPALAHLLRQGALPDRPANYDFLVTRWETDGCFNYVNPPDKVADPAEFAALETETGPWTLRQHPALQHALSRMLKLAQKHDIRIIMIPVPNNDLAYQKFEANGVFATYDKWLDSLQQKFPNFSAPGPRYCAWPGMLGDAGHLNAAGTERHMNLVTEILREKL